jgi:hypothetical protein
MGVLAMTELRTGICPRCGKFHGDLDDCRDYVLAVDPVGRIDPVEPVQIPRSWTFVGEPVPVGTPEIWVVVKIVLDRICLVVGPFLTGEEANIYADKALVGSLGYEKWEVWRAEHANF